jgi:hypothetical protein
MLMSIDRVFLTTAFKFFALPPLVGNNTSTPSLTIYLSLIVPVHPFSLYLSPCLFLSDFAILVLRPLAQIRAIEIQQ